MLSDRLAVSFVVPRAATHSRVYVSLSLSAVADARDSWGRPFVVELVDDDELAQKLEEGASDAPLAVVRSAGKDGKPESEDDLVWRIMVDGSITP